MRIEITILARSVYVSVSHHSFDVRDHFLSLCRHVRDQKIPIGFAHADSIFKAAMRVDIIPNPDARRQDVDAAFSHVVGAICLWGVRMRASICHMPSPTVVRDAEWVLYEDEKGVFSWRKR